MADTWSFTPVDHDPFEDAIDYAHSLVDKQPQPRIVGQMPEFSDEYSKQKWIAENSQYPQIHSADFDSKAYQGGVLPFSIDAAGTKKFDLSAGLPGSVARAVTLPGDVAMGKVDPNSTEAVQRSFDLAGMMQSGAPSGAATGAGWNPKAVKYLDDLVSFQNDHSNFAFDLLGMHPDLAKKDFLDHPIAQKALEIHDSDVPTKSYSGAHSDWNKDAIHYIEGHLNDPSTPQDLKSDLLNLYYQGPKTKAYENHPVTNTIEKVAHDINGTVVPVSPHPSWKPDAVAHLQKELADAGSTDMKTDLVKALTLGPKNLTDLYTPKHTDSSSIFQEALGKHYGWNDDAIKYLDTQGYDMSVVTPSYAKVSTDPNLKKALDLQNGIKAGSDPYTISNPPTTWTQDAQNHFLNASIDAWTKGDDTLHKLYHGIATDPSKLIGGAPPGTEDVIKKGLDIHNGVDTDTLATKAMAAPAPIPPSVGPGWSPDAKKFLTEENLHHAFSGKFTPEQKADFDYIKGLKNPLDYDPSVPLDSTFAHKYFNDLFEHHEPDESPHSVPHSWNKAAEKFLGEQLNKSGMGDHYEQFLPKDLVQEINNNVDVMMDDPQSAIPSHVDHPLIHEIWNKALDLHHNDPGLAKSVASIKKGKIVKTPSPYLPIFPETPHTLDNPPKSWSNAADNFLEQAQDKYLFDKNIVDYLVDAVDSPKYIKDINHPVAKSLFQTALDIHNGILPYTQDEVQQIAGKLASGMESLSSNMFFDSSQSYLMDHAKNELLKDYHIKDIQGVDKYPHPDSLLPIIQDLAALGKDVFDPKKFYDLKVKYPHKQSYMQNHVQNLADLEGVDLPKDFNHWNPPVTLPSGPFAGAKFAPASGPKPLEKYRDLQGPPLPFNPNNLDLSPAAREQRMKDLGYNTEMPLYRGIGVPFEEHFGTVPHLNSLADPRTKKNEPGIFSALDPDVSNAYAGGPNASSSVMYTNAQNIKHIDWPKETGAHSYSGAHMSRILREAIAQGHDAVHIHNIRDIATKGKDIHDQFVSFNPDQLRSKFAVFDPKLKHSANLLASKGMPFSFFNLTPVDHDPFEEQK